MNIFVVVDLITLIFHFLDLILLQLPKRVVDTMLFAVAIHLRTLRIYSLSQLVLYRASNVFLHLL